MKKIIAYSLLSGVLLTNNAYSSGALDFLDSQCKSAEDSTNSAVKANADTIMAIDAAYAVGPNEEYRQEWWDIKRPIIKTKFVLAHAEEIARGDFNIDASFEAWLLSFKNDKEKLIEEKINSAYHTELARGFGTKKQDLITDNQKLNDDFDDACPNDVGNQVLRSSIAIISAPITTVAGNIESAKRENGAINQTIRAVTGVSIKDIHNNGLAGGENSEVRIIGRKIADVFSW